MNLYPRELLHLSLLISDLLSIQKRPQLGGIPEQPVQQDGRGGQRARRGQKGARLQLGPQEETTQEAQSISEYIKRYKNRTKHRKTRTDGRR